MAKKTTYSATQVASYLADAPKAVKSYITDLEQQMDLVREVIVLGRAARNRSGIKTRQPLSTIQIGGLNTAQQSAVNRLQDLIFDELILIPFSGS